ncbi:MAG TPA: hypothetical protein VL283_00485 [Candidatus Baltobacteraceae bacterium]|nr:hypothetical protein [Candidatus Baltobacteraceae bacterium]
MSDRDLLEIFDAALPRLDLFGPGSVPAAGAAEAAEHERLQSAQRVDLGIYAGATAAFGMMAWLFWGPWLPLWLVVVMLAPTAGSGYAALRSFLKLAFNRRLEQALPPGTDATTAQLEDGTWSLIRAWNADAFVWNGRVQTLRTEVTGWQLLKDVPEARDIEWTERGSAIHAEGLIAAIQGLASDRTALVARRSVIEHRLRSLDAKMRQLKASEEAPTLALPPPGSEDPQDG